MPNDVHLLAGARAILWDVAIDAQTYADADRGDRLQQKMRLAMQLLDDVLRESSFMRLDGSPDSYAP